MALAKEGEKRNVFVNTICPIAASRMTETVLPPQALENLKPQYVVPLVAYLAHDSCKETGSIFEIAAGFIAKLRWQRSEGHFFDLPYTVEEVA
jgi:NAD(P)-dependent dehydrogenase (short-subunit alcohol dehydrogenase family)